MNTIDPKPGEAWLIRNEMNDTEAFALREGRAWRVMRSGWLEDFDVTPLRRLVPEPTEYETLMTAAVIYRNRTPHMPSQENVTIDRLRKVADLLKRLEVEHHEAQEKVEREAEREKLIEKADAIFREAWFAADLHAEAVSRVTAGMKALADAGFLTDPEAQAQGMSAPVCVMCRRELPLEDVYDEVCQRCMTETIGGFA